MPELSIVVPVYNVEKYLDRCISSILSQTFSDWEMILVDDGSKDNCPCICDAYSEKDDRIKVIHKENGGLSSARNAGLNAAIGTYIGFVDSDDTVNSDMYSKMIEIIKQTGVDFVMSDYIRIPTSGSPYLKTLAIREGLYSKKDISEEIYPSLIMGSNIDYGPLLSVWHCLYRTDFLRQNDLCFDDDIRWSEDNIFSAKAGYCAESFYYLKGEGLYNYYQNEGTITTSYREGAWKIYTKMNEYLQDYFRDKEEYDFSQELKWHMIYYACVCVSQTNYLPFLKAIEKMKTILYSRHLEEAFNAVDLSGVNKKLKVQLFLMKNKMILLLRYLIKRR